MFSPQFLAVAVLAAYAVGIYVVEFESKSIFLSAVTKLEAQGYQYTPTIFAAKTNNKQINTFRYEVL